MPSETTLAKEKPTAQVQEKVLSRTIREVTPFGIRMEMNLEGLTTGEHYSAQHVETLSIFQKLDGTFESEARAIESTKEGDSFVIQYKGNGKQTGLTTLWAEGEGVIMTQSKKFAQMNGGRFRLEATADIATGEVLVKQFMG